MHTHTIHYLLLLCTNIAAKLQLSYTMYIFTLQSFVDLSSALYTMTQLEFDQLWSISVTLISIILMLYSPKPVSY